MAKQQIRILTLDHNQDGSSVVNKLCKGWILQFRLGTSLLGQSVILHTNYPVKETGNDKFDRTKYQELDWKSDSNNKADDTSMFVNIMVERSGSFHFYLTNHKNENCGQGFFLVDPTLKVGKDDHILPLDCIQCQTVLSKNMGPVSTWPDKLLVAKESGYNMIHFTPVQVIGPSNSAYSLSDQQHLDPKYEADWSQIESLIHMMKNEWEMLSICDVVLNHTANESLWIKEHPECSYNTINSPHLRPAFLLDRMLFQVTLDIASGKLEKDGIPKGILNQPSHFDILERIIKEKYLPPLNFHQFFMINIDTFLKEYESHQFNDEVEANAKGDNNDKLEIILDPERKRLGSWIDMSKAKTQCKTKDELKCKLESLNKSAYSNCQENLNCAISNVINGAKYERIDPKGPKISKCNAENPLICEYFTCFETDHDLKELEEKMFLQNGQFFMAHNGWVMGMDPSVDFASKKSLVYFRRELVAWGDSVKLNYGTCPNDNPFVWEFMRNYVEQVAKTFHGIRLDNCHSTPIHVAEYLLDVSRKIRPDLYVIAELFTGSENTDNIYLNRLGINSLIREGLRAWNSHELGRLVYHYGGAVVGSFSQPHVQPLQPSRVAHAILFDQTHDNQSAMELRTPYDCLPSSAISMMASCAFGSNRGYDELVPHHIHVVKEERQYCQFEGPYKGIVQAKRALNDLHLKLGRDGFNEVFVDQMDQDVVAVTRHDPKSHESVVLVAHTAFNDGVDINRTSTGLWLKVDAELIEVELEAKLYKVKDQEFVQDDNSINGLENFFVDLRTHLDIKDARFVRLDDSNQDSAKTRIELNNFPPGSVIAFRFQLNESQRNACQRFQALMDNTGDLQKIINQLELSDLNHVLFKCDQEDRDTGGGGVYCLNGYGPLKYAGLQGVMSILCEIRPINDLGNWLPKNLRDGDWMMDYIISRLKLVSSTVPLAMWFENYAFRFLRDVPRSLIPRYFDAIISVVYCLLLERIWTLMSDFVKDGSGFVKSLALGSVQHGAVVGSASLPPTVGINNPMVSLAAGLPHFSTGYMRNWGRDTFISLRGFFILTGRFDEARNIILAYGACLRHGLIPNLLDGGFKARFNCRDAVWWWLNCIKSYVQEVPNGHNILKEPVSRIFPQDDSEPHSLGQCVQPLEDVIHEALQKHFQGLKFRERNAGKAIDEHMVDQGFDNKIGVDLQTGFVYGGNIHNCGTWMDKMGSSIPAGNKGQPASPRDGSAIELVGLSYSCIKWLASLNDQGLYKFQSVTHLNDQQQIEWSLKEWAEVIEDNFEQHYFVHKNNPIDARPDLVNKEHIYKDTLNSSQPWTDYQLRCNFPISMVVAPELFNPEQAWLALEIARTKLLGPLGMATLDPDDWMYRPYYDNSNQTEDRTIAHGFNYHQGPEWVWPVGYFLRAYLYFGKRLGVQKEAQSFCMSVLSQHYIHLQQSHWRGIPELTNKNGETCHDSNPIQAWSMACLLEVLKDIEDI